MTSNDVFPPCMIRACACLKHAQPGDANLATVAELEDFLSEGGFDVRR